MSYRKLKPPIGIQMCFLTFKNLMIYVECKADSILTESLEAGKAKHAGGPKGSGGGGKARVCYKLI